MRNRSAIGDRPVAGRSPIPMPPVGLPEICVRCATAGREPHDCIERDGGGPYAYLRDWRSDCPCRAG